MKIDRRLTLLGVMLVVFSMTMATQYASTRMTFSFGIVHPSNADIRFIASDNSSADAKHVIRVNDNSSNTAKYLELSLGDWFPNSMKNYTAAFGIVNEEQFAVYITNITVAGTNADYIDIWLHGNRTSQASTDTGSVHAVDGGASSFTRDNKIWQLAAGNGYPSNMSADGTTQLNTVWDDTTGMRYSYNNVNFSVNGTADFVWVEVSINIPSDADVSQSGSGTVYVNFKAGDP